jgi:hypothetical protein
MIHHEWRSDSRSFPLFALANTPRSLRYAFDTFPVIWRKPVQIGRKMVIV